MEQLVRCKSCGYITRENTVKDVCPACGVPKKMMEPYSDNVSEKRRKILEVHIHPIIVHFPQAFAFTCLLLSITLFIFSGVVRGYFLSSFKVLGIILPFVVIGAFLSGLLDGKTRFRRVSTPILKTKILFGSLFFISSTALFVIILVTRLSSTVDIAIALVLCGICFIASLVLGKLGAGLTIAKFPG